MDYSGTVDYDVNTPFKYEGDEPDTVPQSDDGGVNESSRVHHHQDDLIYPPLDFATPTPQAMDNLHSVPSSNTHLLDSHHSQSLGDNMMTNDTTTNSHISNNISRTVDDEDTTALAMETESIHETDNQPPSSPESEDLPLSRRTAPARRGRGRPARSTRTNKSFAEADDDEEEEFDQKPPKGFVITPLLGTQSIFSSLIQKERRTQLTKGAKKKKKTEPEFCRFCFTNELHLQKVRTAKLPSTSSNPNTKFTSLVPSVIETIQLGLTDKWTNPSFALVCDDCVQVFSSFYEFRTNVETNDALLRKLYCKSKAKSKKLPPSAPATPTPTPPPSSSKGGKRGKAKPDPSSADDSEAVSTVSTKLKKTPGRRGRPPKASAVTDDDDYETDGYLSSVSKTSRKSTTSKKGGSKKKRGVTTDDDTDGYISSVSRKSTTVTNTSAAAKNAKKKRRYNSDSDNEDVKSDVSDGMDFGGPTPYETFNIKQESLDYNDATREPVPRNQQTSQGGGYNGLQRAQKKEKKEKSRRKLAKWKFRTNDVPDAATKAQEELDIVNRRIKQEQEESDEDVRDNEEFVDSSWDDSSGLSSSEWSSVDETDDNFTDDTEEYLTSASTRSTNKKRRKRSKSKLKRSSSQSGRGKSGNVTDRYESETGGETDGEGMRSVFKSEDGDTGLTMDAMIPAAIGGTDTPSLGDTPLGDPTKGKKKKPADERAAAKRRNYCKKRNRAVRRFKQELYPCKYCTTVLKSYDTYLKHLKSNHHGYETSSLCFICGFVSTKRSTLAHHIQDHIQPKTKQKQICEICCAEVYHINGHIKDKHSGFFLQCPHCPKRFPRKTELTNHIKGIHLKHELRQSFVCEYCHKEFTFLQYLKRHMRTHTNEKPYKCACGLGFNFNVSLKNHKQKCSVHLLSQSMQAAANQQGVQHSTLSLHQQVRR